MKAEVIPVLGSWIGLSIIGASTGDGFGGIRLCESGSSAYFGSGVLPLFLNDAWANPAAHDIPVWTNEARTRSSARWIR